MTIIVSARRREAEDLQRLLDGDRASSPRAAQDLAPLLDLARGLAPAPMTPSADFRAALRERLVAEAAARVPAPVVPAQRARPSAPSRFKQAVAAVAVASVVSTVGAAMASTRALPGDSLYGLKRQIENVQLDLARGDISNGRELLQQADARLSEAEALTAGENGSDPEAVARVAQALTEMDAAVTLAAELLQRAYSETGDEEALLLLDRFVTEQRERLDDLMLLLDPSLRERAAALAQRLAVLDAQLAALLGGGTADSAKAITNEAMLASGDGWAVSRISRAVATATGTGAASKAAGPGAGTGDRSTGTGVGVGGVLDAVGDVSGGDATAVGGGSGGGGDGGTGVGDLLPGGTSSGTGVPSVAPVPVPTVSVPLTTPAPRASVPAIPLPTTPTSVPTVPTSVPTVSIPPVSIPPASVCVPVPPLTTC